jgi:hypothetical protein
MAVLANRLPWEIGSQRTVSRQAYFTRVARDRTHSRSSDHHALAEGLETLEKNAPEAFAVRNQSCHGNNAPDDSEHRQTTSQRLTSQRIPCLD